MNRNKSIVRPVAPVKKKQTNGGLGGVRRKYTDSLVVNANANPPVSMIFTSSGTGDYSASMDLSSRGSWNARHRFANGALTVDTVWHEYPKFLWLSAEALRFMEYRVFTCVLVYVPILGTSATGNLRVSSARTINMSSSGIGDNVKSCSIGRSAEWRYSLSVDNSWKKCTNESVDVINGTTPRYWHTIQDLTFSSLQIRGSGIQANTEFGRFHVELDVEFRTPRN
jgi:hypothetical protein